MARGALLRAPQPAACADETPPRPCAHTTLCEAPHLTFSLHSHAQPSHAPAARVHTLPTCPSPLHQSCRYELIQYNASRAILPECIKLTPGKKSPTIQPLEDADFVAVSAMVPVKQVPRFPLRPRTPRPANLARPHNTRHVAACGPNPWLKRTRPPPEATTDRGAQLLGAVSPAPSHLPRHPSRASQPSHPPPHAQVAKIVDALIAAGATDIMVFTIKDCRV